ncbi:HsdR family type I site-specific deoxyribonuclease [Acinetobacter baumannii]|uniref:type I restriction endonuclease subunit R n=2 Tax=Acinetobacter baumannii TaxID=470 RepID=UPI00234196F6|nr:HsdR family type I site-specific deoxyribonuclease [Acinetobacter baumannii]MDC4478550.1 HsdR family type I site-specific deoxyribonuclease [Acinetobacter baumannii]MDC4734312.1 HsdR family type I site-specific deoxyribonuclease [Acinetobacter baumannii]MDC4825535.1 HsdR family type I site-specific deoxyribonuclease [Acinetobacter baumannii]MDI7714738.1 HsdR family type I site-specific deoxyribonuclease [Acinetobacter baumannii]MDR9562046.1 HsdR family type I site-specific deoxyribonuclease
MTLDTINMDYTVNNEVHTQQQVIAVLQTLGFSYLGNWQYRENNSNIEPEYLTEFLKSQGHSDHEISKVYDELNKVLSNKYDGLYEVNKAFYGKLRMGIGVKMSAEENEKTIFLIDWKNRANNRFYVAEEVTLKGVEAERRPDLVLYINGIAIGVIELKRGSVSLGEGIAQLVSNQQAEFNPWFFNTTQLLIAGNTSQGLQYGTTLTPSKFYLNWKEDTDVEEDNILFKYLRRLCNKDRLLEIIYDCIIFDAGVKKLPRSHQYFGLKAAQQYVNKKQGGIIWHTQGAGKSILMVMLAKWILQNKPHARVVVITDRDELDKQIEKVFTQSGRKVTRASSGANLMSALQNPEERLLCTLIHKFGQRDIEDIDAFIADLAKQKSKVFGEVIVFIDECHRTQSGDLHRYMKAIIPQAVMIGFTGTPLLKKDAKNSLEVFGGYIHTYLFKEAVEDGVILDLAYEARDVDQYISDQDAIDDWFKETVRNRNLNEWQQVELKKEWGTRQKLNSSEQRMRKIMLDINNDFMRRIPRLKERGTAILVASSIYEACKYYNLIQDSNSPILRKRCALITSYEPSPAKVSKSIVDSHTETEDQYIYATYEKILQNVKSEPQKTKAETYTDNAKKKFVDHPTEMKLLIVVDKLLTGFDAPSCSVLYLDKSMQDHGLFQAICRTNRLDTADKEYGLIIDYKNLFQKMAKAIAVYNSELDTSASEEAQIEIKNRKIMAKEHLDNAMEQLNLLMQMVQPNSCEEDRLKFFCGKSENPDDLKATYQRRITLYKSVASFFRAFANAKDELAEIGYTAEEIKEIKAKEVFYLDLREKVRLRAGEYLDLKTFEADMRYLIDNYIDAKNSVKVSSFEDKTLIQLIVETGIAETITKKLNNMKDRNSVAETIENNIRSTLIKDHLADPAFHAKMSGLLEEVIKIRKDSADRYAEYLKKIEQLAKQVHSGTVVKTSARIDTTGKKALFNLFNHEEQALELHEFVLNNKPAGWQTHPLKTSKLRNMIKKQIQDENLLDKLMDIFTGHDEFR